MNNNQGAEKFRVVYNLNLLLFQLNSLTCHLTEFAQA